VTAHLPGERGRTIRTGADPRGASPPGATETPAEAGLPPEAEEALERIEDARSEAATYAVQRPEERERIGPAEDRLMDAMEAAEETAPTNTGRLEDLAEEAESARDEIRDSVQGGEPAQG
jgi:hypothetical protein